ncbi:MAG: ferric iron reductase [Pseudomonas sp.]|nr:ferric iron reductase [Pseudomonas sp.]
MQAHPQNTMVLFSRDSKAHSLLIRDFGDGRTYAPLLEERGYALQPHLQPGILPTVFGEDIEPVRMFVLDAAFLTHLHEMALWLTKVSLTTAPPSRPLVLARPPRARACSYRPESPGSRSA